MTFELDLDREDLIDEPVGTFRIYEDAFEAWEEAMDAHILEDFVIVKYMKHPVVKNTVTDDALIRVMAEKSGLTRNEAEKALWGLTESISEALERKEKVTLIGFGTFCVVTRASRTGRNPATGKPINIPARDIPKFIPGSALEEKVAGE